MICRGAKEVDNSQVTEPLREQILKGDVHTIEEMKAWLKPFGYSDACDEMSNMDMIVELLRPQLEVTKEDIEPFIIMGLYHHRNLIGSPSAFIKANNDIPAMR